MKVERAFVDIKPHGQKQKEMKVGQRRIRVSLFCDAFVVLGVFSK